MDTSVTEIKWSCIGVVNYNTLQATQFLGLNWLSQKELPNLRHPLEGSQKNVNIKKQSSLKSF